MTNFHFEMYQGSAESIYLRTTVEGQPKDLRSANVRGTIKRDKHGEPLGTFDVTADEHGALLTLSAETTKAIDLHGDVEVLYYDIFIDDECVLYGTIRMIGGVTK